MTDPQWREIDPTQFPPSGYRNAGTVPFRVCGRCGAVVEDTGVHDEWHEALGG